uniref:MHC class II antigen beta chain n=1 Tax=Oreochromis niloticus TaxID=8128 RepID=A0A3S5GZJ8_ORENI|nr:MHC class II antigen beta chain [Oreochromis niloticus]
MASSFLCLSLLSISLSSADGFKMYMMNRCVFNSTEPKDIRYIVSYYYNKIEVNRFDSDVGKFVGFTEYGLRNAETWNNIPARLASMRAQKGTYCKSNIDVRYHKLTSKSARPTVKLHSTTPLSSHHPAMLVCSVFDFFPSKIKVSWHRDGQEVTSDVTSTEEMEDGDWYYHTHCYLEYTPRSGEKISCVVEHASLEKPLITNWDPSSSSFMPKTERDKLAIGASGLLLCLILSLAGFIYYRRRARGRILVPTN